MKFKPMVILLAIALLLAGCGRAEEAAPTAVPTTVPETMAVELVQTAETTEPTELTESEVVDTTIWLPPYWTEAGKLELHCLVKNETKGNLFVESMQTAYYLNGKIVKEGSYDKNALGKFLWRPFNKLDLTIAASTLLIVNDYPAPDGFDEAIITITTVDEQGQENVLTYNFTMDGTKVTPSTLTDNWELSTSWINDQGGWNWTCEPFNETRDTIELEYVHHICYDNGIPVVAETRISGQLGNTIKFVEALSARACMPYTEGVFEKTRNFNQRETVYVYRDSQGEPYLQRFYFRYEDALQGDAAVQYAESLNREGSVARWERYNPMPEGMVKLEAEETKAAMGGIQYSEAEIRKMIEDDLTLDEVTEKISTIADALEYLNLKGFYSKPTPLIGFNWKGFKWDAMYSGRYVFEVNFAACADGSSLINYILQGDYEEQGYVQEVNKKDRHVFNWFRQGDEYYFIDWTKVSLTGEYGIKKLDAYVTEDPQLFADYYVFRSHAQETLAVYLMYLYPREGTPYPIGVQRYSTPFVRTLPAEIEDIVTLLYEDPEICVLKYREGPPEEYWPQQAR